jgi:hypothetical protein
MKERMDIERLHIKKCWTDPYLAYPQFDRYLTGAQLKVINCLLRFATTFGKAFPSNERIAWEAGLEKGTVANTKMQLVALGVLEKEKTNELGNTIWMYTINTEWRKAQYRNEFDEKFNPAYSKRAKTAEEQIAELSASLLGASADDKQKILEQLKHLTEKL